MLVLVSVSVLQEMKPEEKKAKDRQLWKDWIDQYRCNKIISICVFLTTRV